MGAGIVANTVANLVYSYHDQLQDPVPFPAWSDLFFLASYVAFGVAIVLITQVEAPGAAQATRLDGLVVGLSAGAVAVALWFDTILEQTGSTATVLVGLAYPLFDVALVVVGVSGLAPNRFRPRPSTFVVLVGIALFTLGDVVFLRQVTAGTYVSGTPLELTWSAGITLLGLADWIPAAAVAPAGPSAAPP